MGEVILDYLGAPNVITRILVRGKQENQNERRYGNWSRDQSDAIAGFEDGKGHRPRNVGRL